MSHSAPQIVRDRMMNPDYRAWLAATAMTLPRSAMGEDLRVEMPISLRTLVKVTAEKTKVAGHSSLCFQKLADDPRMALFFAIPGHRAHKK